MDEHDFYYQQQLTYKQAIAELEAKIVSDRELLAQAMLDMGMSTGHGGSTSDLVDELKLNVAELKENG